MQPLSGKISDRIRSGENADVDIKFKGRNSDEDPPSADAVKHGSGRSLGKPSWRTAQDGK